MENKMDGVNDLQERENFIAGKIEFFPWFCVENCVKDKITGYYAIQLMGVDKIRTTPRLISTSS